MPTKPKEDTSWRDLYVDCVITLTPFMDRMLDHFDIATCGQLSDADPTELLYYPYLTQSKLDALHTAVREGLCAMGYVQFGTIPLPIEQQKPVEAATPYKDTLYGKREFIEEFIMRRASTVTGELNGMSAAYEASRAWMKLEELCAGDVA